MTEYDGKMRVNDWCKSHPKYDVLENSFVDVITCDMLLRAGEKIVIESLDRKLRIFGATMLMDMEKEHEEYMKKQKFKGPYDVIRYENSEILKFTSNRLYSESMQREYKRGRITPKELFHIYPKEIELKKIDVSCCDLTDEDYIVLVDFILTRMKLCEEVDFSNNYIHGYNQSIRRKFDKTLLSLLDNHRIKYVNMTGNPFATTDRKDFFENYIVNTMNSLIWIPRDLLDSDGWKILLQDNLCEEVCNRILQVHKKYYGIEK